jgi:hypothetical protein
MMRKMVIAELVVFAATLAMSHGASAQEAKNLPTVSVTGQFWAGNNFGWTYNGLLQFTTPPWLGYNGGNVSASEMHALNCAKAYATTGPGANQGPKPGDYTFIVSNYGWAGPDGTHYETLTDTPPVANAIMLGGSTYAGITMVFLPLNPDAKSLITTLAHEWAHQWGAQDLRDGSANDAYAIGNAAQAAYLADKGAKCGGL